MDPQLKSSMSLRNDPEALFVVFYVIDSGGNYDPAEMPELDMEAATTIPAVGDFVYDMPHRNKPIAYRVVSRHFDPKGRRVAVVTEEVSEVDNSPFL